jgi:hypothetical protein
VEFEFSNFTSLLRSVSSAAKVLLALYFGHDIRVLIDLIKFCVDNKMLRSVVKSQD